MVCTIVVATGAILAVRGHAGGVQAAQLATAQVSSAVYAQHSLEGTALADRQFPAAVETQRLYLDGQMATAIADLQRHDHAADPRGLTSLAIRFDGVIEDALAAIARRDFTSAQRIDRTQVDPIAAQFARRLSADSSALARSARAESRVADFVSLVVALLAAGFLAWLARRVLEIERRSAHDAALARAATETEAELRQAQKMDAVGRLAAGVAHDFNNLLTGIMGHASLIATRVSPDDPNNKSAHEIIGCAARAAELTQRLLAFGRKQELRAAEVNLRALVEGMEGLIAGVLRDDVTVLYDLRDDPCVLADANQLEQVILNLVVNAQHAMPNGGAIGVSLEEVEFSSERSVRGERLAPGSYAEIVITDNGDGMDADTITKIFEPFFTTKGEQGTGLGLPTSVGIVTQSGGQIDLTSTLGSGTRFQIFLPTLRARDIPRPRRLAAVA
jgi:signal transduction histidine kinase